MSRRKLLILSTLVALLALGLGSIVYAAASGPPGQDTYARLSSPGSNYGTDPNLWAEGSSDSGACIDTRVSYLQWDLSNPATGTISNATLTMRVNFSSGDLSGAQLALYEASDKQADGTTDWTEGNVNWDNRPILGNQIQAVTIPEVNPEPAASVTFNAAALATYLQGQLNGDKKASLAIKIVGNCGGATVNAVMDSAETTSGATPNLNMTGPNSVTLNDMSANTGVNWPLYVGLVAVVVALGGFVLMAARRRSA